jgi:tetratricopeptide (TPR) repeat protein
MVRAAPVLRPARARVLNAVPYFVRTLTSASGAPSGLEQAAAVDARAGELLAAERWADAVDAARAARIFAESALTENETEEALEVARRAGARLAFALLQTGDYRGAVTEYEILLEREGELPADADAEARGARAKILSNYSEALAHRGDTKGAFGAAERAVELVSGPNRAGLEDVAAGVLCNQASLISAVGTAEQTSDAVNVAQEALDLANESLGRTHEYTRTCLRALAFASARHGGEPQVEGVVDDWIQRGDRDRASLEKEAQALYDEDRAQAKNTDGYLSELEERWSRAPVGKFDPPGIVLPPDASLDAFGRFRKR